MSIFTSQLSLGSLALASAGASFMGRSIQPADPLVVPEAVNSQLCSANNGDEAGGGGSPLEDFRELLQGNYVVIHRVPPYLPVFLKLQEVPPVLGDHFVPLGGGSDMQAFDLDRLPQGPLRELLIDEIQHYSADLVFDLTRAKNAVAREAVAEAMDQHDQLEHEAEALRSELFVTGTKVVELKRQNATLERALRVQLEDIDGLNETNIRLKARLEVHQEEAARLDVTVEQLIAALARFRDRGDKRRES